MNMLHGAWLPLATYDALEVKPRYAVFFFPAVQIDGNSWPEEVRTSRELAARTCTHWHPIQDPKAIGTQEKPQSHPVNTQLSAKQIAALSLLENGKADFHAAIMVGANLSVMSALVKAGLATVLQGGGVKQWQITDLGMTALKGSRNATTKSV